MFTAPPNIALAWASSSSLLERLSAAWQNPARTNPSRPVDLANGTQSRKGVCVNDQSEHVAYFVWYERGCKEWEKKDDNGRENQKAQD